jgi:predicted ATP-grasp superfamily ATP-dependent carboligase
MTKDPTPSRRGFDVLMTQGWGKIAYNVVRSLGRERLRVVVGTDKLGGMAALSRYAAEHFRHPFVTLQTAAFVRAVRDALRRYSPAVYLPTSDDTYVASRFIDEFQATGTIVPIAPFATIRTLHKKNEVAALASSLGIPTPETIVPKCDVDVRAFFKEFGPEIVLKRISSSGARGVFYLKSDEEYQAWCRDALVAGAASDDWILQRRVPGAGYGVSMLFNRGQMRAKFTHRRLREKTATGGISTVRTAVVNPELEDYAQRLLETVNFHGVAMVEFKHDERTGRNWLLEVNPRFWGSLGLAIRAGVNFPYLLYRMAVDGDVDPVLRYRSGVTVTWLLGDIGARAAALRSGKGFGSNSAAAFKADAYDDLFWDDPLPFFGGAMLSVRKFLETRRWAPDLIDVDIAQLEALQLGDER